MTAFRAAILAAALLALTLPGQDAHAQGGRNLPAPPPQPPAAAPATPPAAPSAALAAEGPDRTSASFGDWTLRCETLRPPGQPALRSCELALTYLDQRRQPVAQIVIGRAVPTEPTRLILQVPIEVRTDMAARLQPDPAAADQVVELAFRICSAARGGCFAETELTAELERQLRGRGENPGRIDYRNSAGQPVALPLSFRGLGAALDALAREQG